MSSRMDFTELNVFRQLIWGWRDNYLTLSDRVSGRELEGRVKMLYKDSGRAVSHLEKTLDRMESYIRTGKNTEFALRKRIECEDELRSRALEYQVLERELFDGVYELEKWDR